jgi:hypothetical protein
MSMTTTNRPNEIIDRARRRYLAANPLRLNCVPTVDLASGERSGEMTFPNIGDMNILGCKLGIEYLAICHDDEAVEEWIDTAMGIAKDPELVGILFANVFRGVNILIGNMIDGAGARTRMQQLAVEAWGRDFSDFTSAEEPHDDPEPFDPEVDPW